MLSAREVADYFLASVDEEAGDSLSNLKLQKLVYYAQGFYLANYGKPLFPEQLEAWEHGPVVPELYRAFKQHGAEPIPLPDSLDFEKYPAEVRELLDEVYSVYGQFSASKLRRMTHAEAPWKEAYNSGSRVISQESLSKYFSSLLANAS